MQNLKPDSESTQLILKVPKSIDLKSVDGSFPLTRLTYSEGINEAGTTDDFAFPGKFNSNYTATVDVPVNIARTIKNISLYFHSNTQSALGPYTFANGMWKKGLKIYPGLRTLVLVHGIESSVQDAFGPCIDQIIKAHGNQHYDQVVGLNYDWTQTAVNESPILASLISQLGEQAWVDIEAHSYGTIVALGAIPTAGTKIRNLVLLGGPLDGTQLASGLVLNSIFAALPSSGLKLAWLASSFADAEKSGMTDQLKPGSPALLAIERAVYPSYAPVRTIKVAGGLHYKFEDDSDYAVYDSDEDYGHKGPGSLGTYDGIVPAASALSKNVPTEKKYQILFSSVLHTSLECNPSVVDYVGSVLSTPSPPPQNILITDRNPNDAFFYTGTSRYGSGEFGDRYVIAVKPRQVVIKKATIEFIGDAQKAKYPFDWIGFPVKGYTVNGYRSNVSDGKGFFFGWACGKHPKCYPAANTYAAEGPGIACGECDGASGSEDCSDGGGNNDFAYVMRYNAATVYYYGCVHAHKANDL